jgi:hypothetical protein
MAWFSNVKQIEIDWVLRKLVDWYAIVLMQHARRAISVLDF